jgi:hypothetical protein
LIAETWTGLPKSLKDPEAEPAAGAPPDCGQRVWEAVKSLSFEHQREEALALILNRLNLAGHIDRPTTYDRSWASTQDQFRLVVGMDSLWDGIWQLFGWDTVGISWRHCPHCQHIFYPKRHDQYYCSPRQQALASKRAYAARRRAYARRTKKRLRVPGKGVRKRLP